MLLLRCYGLRMSGGGFASAGRVLVQVPRRLGTGAAVRSGSGVMVVVMLLSRRSGLVHVVVRVTQLTVLSDQIFHLPLELVDTLALRLDEALLVLHDSG